ncbi:MAG: DUF455 domain-containing protein [Gammaproteobacteria bacterium HGW-Gammaproteobacteria-1]|jgi:uncharacterized ferritin-like protein (DUF455 family)|nr:MAG: DUF455 domain-containing protein [Gammaproteobacteria bacterium HGW-Gammaproteobacteria-1]
MTETNLFNAALDCLRACEAADKVALTRAAAQAWREGGLSLAAAHPPQTLAAPGRPARLRLVMPRELPRRRPDSREGRAILFHALTHIEFNAINLAWDAVYRFRAMPRAFYDDWIRVAEEEAQHFELLRAHLNTLDADYGDWPGHNGLWEMALKTAHDPLVRMALVPRCLEARGLDVNPGIQDKLRAAGDTEGCALLDIILRDEIGHVAIGDRWFRHLCAERGLAVETTYRSLMDEYMKGPPRGLFHLEARRSAGFSEAELAYLQGVG